MIHRSFGKNFAIHYPNPEQAWGSALNILKQVEMIEGTPPDIAAEWDMKTGHFTQSVPYSISLKQPAQLAKLEKNPKVNTYSVGHGNSYQVFLLKGICPRDQSTLVLGFNMALYYLNNDDDSIPA